MGRSYLYPGRDTDTLTPQERQLERLYDQIDRPGNRLTATQFFQTPEAAQLLDQLYGGLSDRLPPGSQIVSQTPGKITYRDPEGYEHNLVRKPDGQFTETTNRPPIVPTAASKGQEDFLGELIQRARRHIAAVEGGPQLAELPSNVQAQFDAISAAEQAANEQQLGELQGQLLARLFGQGVNRSSIATNAGARFAQQAGLVQQQQQADDAARRFGARELLTRLGQQQNEGINNLLATLTGQSNQRDIAGAGLALDRLRLDEAGRQFNASNYLDQLRTQIEQQKVDSANSPFNKILGAISAGGQLASGIGGGLGAFRALTGGK